MSVKVKLNLGYYEDKKTGDVRIVKMGKKMKKCEHKNTLRCLTCKYAAQIAMPQYVKIVCTKPKKDRRVKNG